MKKVKIKVPEKFYYWYNEKTKQYNYQINYNIGYCDVGTAKNLDEIKELEKKLNIKAEKIEEE